VTSGFCILGLRLGLRLDLKDSFTIVYSCTKAMSSSTGIFKQFTLDMSLKMFIQIVWEEDACFRSVLKETGETEESIGIGKWTQENLGTEEEVFKRTIISRHPLPWMVRLSLPWLPPDIISTNVQSMRYDSSNRRLLIRESSDVKGIPFVEPTIIINWQVRERGRRSVECAVSLDFVYAEPFFLESLLESQASSEIGKLVDVIEVYAKQKIEESRNASSESHDLCDLSGLLPRDRTLSFKMLELQETFSLRKDDEKNEESCSFSALVRALNFFT
jgi:hypothetical protein